MISDSAAESNWVVGIDIGGTKTLGVLLDKSNDLEVAESITVTTPRAASELIPSVLSVISMLKGDLELAGIGIGLPGLVDRRGVLRYGPNVPGVFDVDIATSVGERFAMEAVVDNDANFATLAEHRLGAGAGSQDMVLVTLGTGIGGGLVVGGQLVRGANGFAGEPGHMLINRDGPLCACGIDGCWEALASGTGLGYLGRTWAAANPGSEMEALVGSIEAIRGEVVATAARSGDPGAEEVFSEFAGWVAAGLSSIINLLDPEVVVIGGGLSSVTDFFLPQVERQLAAGVLGSSYRPPVRLVPAAFGPEAGAIGAAIASVAN